MNQLQEIEYDILVKFDAICKKNKLKYFLAYGTALGAVRHGGFIPWDDDIDVVMLRDDYEKLCSLPLEEFPEDLFLQNVYTEINYPYPFAKIRKNYTTFVEEDTKNLRIHHGIFIDVFPLDYIPVKKIQRLIQLFWAEYIWILMSREKNLSFWKRMIVNILNCGGRSDEKYLQRLKKAEREITRYKNKTNSVALLSYGGRAVYAHQRFPLNEFTVTAVKFETQEFNIMRGWKHFLAMSYGDFMLLPPEKERVAGHNCVYLDYEKSIMN